MRATLLALVTVLLLASGARAQNAADGRARVADDSVRAATAAATAARGNPAQPALIRGQLPAMAPGNAAPARESSPRPLVPGDGLCYDPGTPGTPDVFIPGIPATPAIGDAPGTPGTPDQIIPGIPATAGFWYPCR